MAVEAKTAGTTRETAYPTFAVDHAIYPGRLHPLADGANPGKGKVTQVFACAQDARMTSS